MNDCFLRNNAIPRRLNLNDFKFHFSLVTSYGESIALPDWAVGVAEVRSEVDIKERASEAFDAICRRQDDNTPDLSDENKLTPQ